MCQLNLGQNIVEFEKIEPVTTLASEDEMRMGYQIKELLQMKRMGHDLLRHDEVQDIIAYLCTD